MQKVSTNENNCCGTLHYLIGQMSFDAKDIKDKVTAVIKTAYDIGVDGAPFEKTAPCIEIICEIIKLDVNLNINRVDALWAQLINPTGASELEVVKRKNPSRTQRKKELPPSKKQKSDDGDEDKPKKVIQSSDDESDEDDDVEIEFINYDGDDNQQQVSPQTKKDSDIDRKRTFRNKRDWPKDEYEDLLRIMKNHPEYTYQNIRDKLVKLGYDWRTDKSVSGKVWNERVKANKRGGSVDEDSN